jgi:hypothetical protein
LSGIQSLLEFRIVKQSKLGFGGAEVVVYIEWVHCLGEEWRVGRQKVRIR